LCWDPERGNSLISTRASSGSETSKSALSGLGISVTSKGLELVGSVGGLISELLGQLGSIKGGESHLGLVNHGGVAVLIGVVLEFEGEWLEFALGNLHESSIDLSLLAFADEVLLGGGIVLSGTSEGGGFVGLHLGDADDNISSSSGRNEGEEEFHFS